MILIVIHWKNSSYQKASEKPPISNMGMKAVVVALDGLNQQRNHLFLGSVGHIEIVDLFGVELVPVHADGGKELFGVQLNSEFFQIARWNRENRSVRNSRSSLDDGSDAFGTAFQLYEISGPNAMTNTSQNKYGRGHEPGQSRNTRVGPVPR